MPLTLNNRKDIVADSVSVVKGNTIVDLIESLDAVTGLAPATLNSLEKLATALNNDSGFFTTVTTALNNKADVSTTYTRTASNLLLDAKVDDTEMVNYATKADTFTKTEVNEKFTNIIAGAPEALNTLKELSDALGADQNFSTSVTNTLGLKAPIASPAFTGTVTGITKAMVQLGNVDNTSDLAKVVSTATQTALDLKAPLASPAFTGTVTGLTKAMVQLGNVDNTTDLAKVVSTATQTALDLKAPLESPAFTGTVTGITKAMVQLGNVDNTTDSAKIISSATQTALNSKAPLESPTFTGNATVNNLKANASLYTDDPLGLMLGGAGVNTLGDLTVGGTALITGNLPAPSVYTKDQTNDKLAERQLNITTPSVSGAVNVFGGNTIYPLKAGMGMMIYQTLGSNFVTIDGPFNCENSYYP